MPKIFTCVHLPIEHVTGRRRSSFVVVVGPLSSAPIVRGGSRTGVDDVGKSDKHRTSGGGEERRERRRDALAHFSSRLDLIPSFDPLLILGDLLSFSPSAMLVSPFQSLVDFIGGVLYTFATCLPSLNMSAAASTESLGQYRCLALTFAAPNVLNVHIKIGKLNAMSQLFWREMRECFTKIGQSAEVRSVLITAEGRVFTAGLDLMDHADSFLTASGDDDVARRMIRMKPNVLAYQDSFSVIESINQPVVVAIQGACIGGGVDLITAADIRMCTTEAFFSVKEVDVGMAADVGTLQRLPKVVSNQSLVREWCFTGRKITSAEALSSGLVSRVLPTKEALLKEALALCVEIAAKSPVAVTGTKVMLNYSRDHSVKDSLDYVALWNAAALQTKDVALAMEFNTAKKQAIFSNL